MAPGREVGGHTGPTRPTQPTYGGLTENLPLRCLSFSSFLCRRTAFPGDNGKTSISLCGAFYQGFTKSFPQKTDAPPLRRSSNALAIRLHSRQQPLARMAGRVRGDPRHDLQLAETAGFIPDRELVELIRTVVGILAAVLIRPIRQRRLCSPARYQIHRNCRDQCHPSRRSSPAGREARAHARCCLRRRPRRHRRPIRYNRCRSSSHRRSGRGSRSEVQLAS